MIDYRTFLPAESYQIEDAPVPLPTWRDIAFAVFMGLAFVASVIAVAMTGCVR